ALRSSPPISTWACTRPRSWNSAPSAPAGCRRSRGRPVSTRHSDESRAPREQADEDGQMGALLIRDLRLATRSGGGFGLALAFFLIVCTLVPFGVGPEGGQLSRIAPGILWVGALLSCLLSLDRIFALDFEDGSLDLLATAPLPLEGAVAVKALAHWL